MVGGRKKMMEAKFWCEWLCGSFRVTSSFLVARLNGVKYASWGFFRVIDYEFENFGKFIYIGMCRGCLSRRNLENAELRGILRDKNKCEKYARKFLGNILDNTV